MAIKSLVNGIVTKISSVECGKNLEVTNDGLSYDPNAPKAVVLYRYEATEDQEITLEEGSLIDIIEEASDGWWKGCTIAKVRKEGIFPFNYVRKLTSDEFEEWLQGDDDDEDDEQQQQQVKQQMSKLQVTDNNSAADSSSSSSSPASSYIKPSETHSTATSTSQTNADSNITVAGSPSTPPPQRLSTAISSSSPAQHVTIREGYLTKKGHIRRNWNVRWFQLKRNVLTYAKSPKESKVSGELVLTPDTQVDIATSMKRTNCFQIKVPNHNNTNKELLFYCSAQSTDDMESWIACINQAKIVH
ncbi:hypothetical protein SAMD00019534_002000 [Acytostelium subglobosum LB1]|uniref:hypothetical protein n=1 Tax=Acytostelium subglobosum LB1 TaxID=1410327 RepID=UPI00064510D3|nr:hypothetical protein SAMD00019534_002000 [Acytostelium subglobosum LB1]GAM17025.1 hypothetical protein SAMD00019534_002000 [Acytostelium subglobosum LB1]|eukprot:XP_012759087.1 hypothetical protein SAMD00019534_002000 [Acytostelium subglobosum LB1]